MVSCGGVTWCGSRAVGSRPQWRVVLGECLCGGLSRCPGVPIPVAVSPGGLAVDWVSGRGVMSVSLMWCVPPPPVSASSPFRNGVAPTLSCSEWWPSGDSLPLCCVARSALFPWVRARHLVPFPALLPRAFPFPFPFAVPRWWGAGEVCGKPMAHARGRGVLSYQRRLSGV